MKKFSILMVSVLILSFLVFSQQKDIIATTEDGRRVLLKADGTWKFIEEQKPKKESPLREVKSWKGQGIKKTESFIITTNEWAIVWATSPQKGGFSGILQIFVYKEGSEIPDIATNVMGENQDNSVMRGKGKYWLEINSTQIWSVGVYEIIK